MLNPSVRFLDLQRQYRSVRPEIEAAVERVHASSIYVLGPEVEQFEYEFANHQGTAHGVAVNSGTSALHLALLAAGIGPGDEVITVGLTFMATVAAISYTGALPVLVDVDAESLTLDPSAIAARITPRTRAIVPVHLYGQAADMNPILGIAARNNLMVIEDACQAHGAEYKGQRVGGIGHMAAFSFYPGKNLGAYGEGGMVTTNDSCLARQLRMLRDWGQEQKGRHEILGYNYRMDALQAAMLRIKLAHLEEWTELRRSHASYYRSHLSDEHLLVPPELPDRRHVYHIFSVFTPAREQLSTALAKEGVETGMHYPVPVHLQPAFEFLGYSSGDLPVTERAATEQLSLPLYPELREEEIDRVVDAIGKWAPAPGVSAK